MGGAPGHSPEGRQVLRVPHRGVEAAGESHVDVEAHARPCTHLCGREHGSQNRDGGAGGGLAGGPTTEPVRGALNGGFWGPRADDRASPSSQNAGSARLAWGGCGADPVPPPWGLPVARGDLELGQVAQAGGDDQGRLPAEPLPASLPGTHSVPTPHRPHAFPGPSRRPHLVGGAAAREEVAVVVAMQRDVQDARVAVEGLLGPVAVVHILAAGRCRH